MTYYVIIFCTFAAPNAGVACVDSPPIATELQCKQEIAKIEHNVFKRCEERRD